MWSRVQIATLTALGAHLTSPIFNLIMKDGKIFKNTLH